MEYFWNGFLTDHFLPLQRLEIGFNLSSSAFQKGRQGQLFAEIGGFLVDRESGTIGGQFKENLIRFAKIKALEVEAIDFSAVGDPEISQPPRPGMICLLISDAKCKVMNAARAGSMMRKIRTDPDMQFRRRTTSTHFVHLNAELGPLGIGIFQG